MANKMVALCPRCNNDYYTPYSAEYSPGDPLPPALSRTDNETYICSDCGSDEAMQEFIPGEMLSPIESWPIEIAHSHI